MSISLSQKLMAEPCYIRSACREKSDRDYVKSMFERDWEVFLIKRDPNTGKFVGETLCCDYAAASGGYEHRSIAAACC